MLSGIVVVTDRRKEDPDGRECKESLRAHTGQSPFPTPAAAGGVRLAEEQDIRRILTVYYQQDVTTEWFAGFDGKELINARGGIKNAMLFNTLSFFSHKLLTEGNTVAALDELTRPLFAIPTHHFLFNAGNVDGRFFADNLQLTRSEFDLIHASPKAVCLFKCGNERYQLEVKAPEHKKVLFGEAGGK